MLQKQATAVQAHSRWTLTELTEFHRSVSSERASNVNQKSSQRRHDAAEQSGRVDSELECCSICPVCW